MRSNVKSANKSRQKSTFSLKPRNHQCHTSLIESSYPTYSQLQIVLESIQKIKQSAQKEIKQLQQQNNQLRQERDTFKSLITGNNKKDQDLQTIQQKMQAKYKQQIQSYKEIITQLNKDKNKLQIQAQKFTYKQQALTNQIKQLTQSQKALQKIIRTYQYSLKDIGLNITESHQIQDKHQILLYLSDKQTNVPLLIKQFQLYKMQCQSQSEQNLNLRQQYHLVFEQKQKLIQNIKLLQSQLDISKIKIQKSVQEIQNLTQQIAQRQLQIRNQQQLINKRQKQYQSKLNNLQVLLKQKEQSYQKQKLTLLDQKQQLLKIKQQAEIRQNKKRGLQIYDKIVSQVSQNTQKMDYQRVLARIQYLQRYRSQYYYNIQKIQYLCKMLDI